MSEERRVRREQTLVPWLENEDKFYVARKLRTLFIVLANACPLADVATNICQGAWGSWRDSIDWTRRQITFSRVLMT